MSTGFAKALNETLKCNIHLSCPIKPPVIFGRCHRRIIGCQKCVEIWYKVDEGPEICYKGDRVKRRDARCVK